MIILTKIFGKFNRNIIEEKSAKLGIQVFSSTLRLPRILHNYTHIHIFHPQKRYLTSSLCMLPLRPFFPYYHLSSMQHWVRIFSVMGTLFKIGVSHLWSHLNRIESLEAPVKYDHCKCKRNRKLGFSEVLDDDDNVDGKRNEYVAGLLCYFKTSSEIQKRVFRLRPL